MSELGHMRLALQKEKTMLVYHSFIQYCSAVESVLPRHLLMETTGHFHCPLLVRICHALTKV